ncbi:MAG: YbaB/EbfC family nucleoid-associated protein [Bdellovibrionaceae bacterium]|nr:YbaB/EbfC family nucleoid-associated protein [Pseudobdellovibrionaceae bacterium]
MKGMPGGMAQLMKQANQMQMRIKKLQEELSSRNFEGTSGGGAVTVTVNGEHLVTGIKISPDVLSSGDSDMLQDLVMTATNEAIKLAKSTHQKEMEKITGGMGIPGLF